MKFLKSAWFPAFLGIVIIIIVFKEIATRHATEAVPVDGNKKTEIVAVVWQAPDIATAGDDATGQLVRYGRELIANTARYLGPHGSVAAITNGMNCQNCHINAGATPFGNCFSAVASTYPKFRERSGRMESIEWRVNECLERSLNGKSIDSLSKEMRAMVSYLQWLGKDVSKGVKPVGSGVQELPFLERAADPAKGKIVYEQYCQRCHGANGSGQLNFDSMGYAYPPLWGAGSYNVSAGLYRLTKLAAYIKDNMPFGVASHDSPQLTTEEAWDVAAFINAQPHPAKFFRHDWPDISTKPVDYPYGPYTDGFSEQQHKYGPFQPIKDAKKR